MKCVMCKGEKVQDKEITLDNDQLVTVLQCLDCEEIYVHEKDTKKVLDSWREEKDPPCEEEVVGKYKKERPKQNPWKGMVTPSQRIEHYLALLSGLVPKLKEKGWTHEDKEDFLNEITHFTREIWDLVDDKKYTVCGKFIISQSPWKPDKYWFQRTGSNEVTEVDKDVLDAKLEALFMRLM